MDTAKQYLIENGIKPSVQRLAIMMYLLEHRTHPTVDEIFNDLSKSIPTLSKTTVYNTLKIFAEKGAILSLKIEEKMVRFDGYVHNCHERGSYCHVYSSQEISLPSGVVTSLS